MHTVDLKVVHNLAGYAVAQLVEALRYEPEGLEILGASTSWSPMGLYRDSFHVTLHLALINRHSQALTGPYDFRRLRLPNFLDSRHIEVVRLSVLRTGRFTPPPPPFLLEAESTPGPNCDRKD